MDNYVKMQLSQIQICFLYQLSYNKCIKGGRGIEQADLLIDSLICANALTDQQSESKLKRRSKEMDLKELYQAVVSGNAPVVKNGTVWHPWIRWPDHGLRGPGFLIYIRGWRPLLPEVSQVAVFWPV